jgi:hypothetical protein
MPPRPSFTSRRHAAAVEPLFETSEDFPMMAAVSAMAARVGESAFARWWFKVGDVLDRAIPIALVIALAIGTGAILFGFVH